MHRRLAGERAMTREHVMGKGLATLASHCNFNFNFNFMLFCLRCREKMEGKAPRYVKPFLAKVNSRSRS